MNTLAFIICKPLAQMPIAGLMWWQYSLCFEWKGWRRKEKKFKIFLARSCF